MNSYQKTKRTTAIILFTAAIMITAAKNDPALSDKLKAASNPAALLSDKRKEVPDPAVSSSDKRKETSNPAASLPDTTGSEPAKYSSNTDRPRSMTAAHADTLFNYALHCEYNKIQTAGRFPPHFHTQEMDRSLHIHPK